ncbi:MAG: DedA family protein [Actinobacteria bacterium]|nr:DedA family protein [Actinomycetota bacterium]
MFHQFIEWVSGAWWTYPLIFAIAMLDAFFPIVPSESVVITAGVVAATGDLNLAAVIALAAAGAIVGDNVSYGIGTWLGEHTVKKIFRGEKSRKGFEWAERQLAERGMYLIVIARFIPGGRTAVTFSAGYIHTFPWRRFIVADVVAGVVWAHYAALLGYFGGKQFKEEPWKGLLLAFVLAVGVAVAIEVGRHYLRKRRAAADAA